MMLKNKKANVTFIVAMVIISVLSFFVVFKFFISTSESISSSVEDAACKTLISTKSDKILKIADYFSSINYKCKQEFIKIKSEQKEEIYRDVAESMNKCWYRYGEGKFDFLSNYDTTGNYCFTCAEVSFDDKIKGNIYEYNDFILWLQKNNFRTKNGTNMKYGDFLSLKYATPDKKDLVELKSIIDEIKQEKDPVLNSLGLALSENYLYLQDFRLKRISTNENLFIVYRYDRASNDFSQVIENTLVGAGAGLAASTAVEAGVGLIVGALVAGPVGIGYGVYKILKKAKKVEKLKEYIEKINRAFSIIKKTLKYTGIAGVGVGGVTGAYVGTNLNYNQVQYIDIMDKEQYYRSCGTQSFEK